MINKIEITSKENNKCSLVVFGFRYILLRQIVVILFEISLQLVYLLLCWLA